VSKLVGRQSAIAGIVLCVTGNIYTYEYFECYTNGDGPYKEYQFLTDISHFLRMFHLFANEPLG